MASARGIAELRPYGSLKEGSLSVLTISKVAIELDAGFGSVEQVWQVKALVRRVNGVIR
jgi:hypothetical protein